MRNNLFEKKTSEVKYRWDEENRLLGVDENGFVSHYFYDANGERALKVLFGNGSLINIILPSPNNSNSYDNAMIRRAVKWAKNRYRLQPVLQANGEFEMMATKTGFSPTNMQVYTQKRRNI